MPAVLPAAVRRQADRATQLMSQAAAERTGQPAPASPAATPAPAPAATDVAALQKKLDETLEELRKSNERVAALDGKLRAEIPRTAAENRQLREDLKKAEERAKALEAEVKKKVDTLTVSSLTDDERRLAGDDMVRVTAKVARELVDARLQEVLQPVNDRLDAQDKLRREAYFLALDEGVPNWEAINDTPAFSAWLNQIDPSTQRLRMDRIKRAEALANGPAVVEIFRAYLEKREIGVPLSTQPQPKPEPGAPETRIDVGDGGGNAVTFEKTQDGKRIWTRADIKRHYDGKTAGEWRGREKEWRELELDIYAAYKENRVKG